MAMAMVDMDLLVVNLMGSFFSFSDHITFYSWYEEPDHQRRREDRKRIRYSPDFLSAGRYLDGMEDRRESGELVYQMEEVRIAGSSSLGLADWKYSAEQFVKKFPEKVFVHRSESNSSTFTFDGVDMMGERLANEVFLLLRTRGGLKKISFVSHLLGGLVARYCRKSDEQQLVIKAV
ncbi:hypothetical protein Bca52824_024324 [Brassica carinata]|uniref:DUF676 domain-containing protein n=1 Tax=Brassica carinata TaxID=52824 RepID=A0A8X7VK60_BRACI|nr:hypothetical protein Bca52824_024324 [Brassica carinata]